MKKILMKLLFILVMVFSFGGIDVYAKTITKSEAFTRETVGKIYVNGMTVGDKNFHLNRYKSRDTSNETFVSYCMDPHKQPGTNYSVERILGEITDSKEVEAFDYGLLEILKNGYNQYQETFNFTVNNQTKSISGNSAYAATGIAIRAYALGVFGYGKDIDRSRSDLREYYIREASSFVTRGIQWGSYYNNQLNAILSYDSGNNNYVHVNCTGSYEQIVSCYTDFIKNKRGATWYSNSYIVNYKEGTESDDVIYAAQYLFFKGILKAYDVATGNASNATVNTTVNNNASDKETNGNYITEYYYQTIDFKNFDYNGGNISNFVLTCTDCAKNNVTLGGIEVYNPDIKKYEKYSEKTSNFNVLNYFKTETSANTTLSGQIKLRFKVTRLKDDSNCSSVDFKIDYNYYDPSFMYIGAMLSAGSDKQRFFVVQKNGDGSSSLSGSTSGKIKCNIVCETNLEVPVCDEDSEKSTAKITGPTNIKSCVINNEDDAGNDYQFTSSAGGVDNDYCKVYCKEDYAEIKLNPIINNVKCGGYFKLTSKVNGTKTCYTGGDTDDKSINKAKFITDIIDAQKNMIEKYNEYYKWEQSVNFIEPNYTKYESKKAGRSCHTDSEGNQHCRTTCKSSTNCGGFDVNMFEKSGVYGYNINCNDTTGVCTVVKNRVLTNSYGEDGGANGKCNSGSCTSGSQQTLKKNIASKVASAKSELEAAIKKYEKIITDYNSCTTAWTNKFAFKQKVKYYYDENRGEDGTNYSTYYDLLNKKESLKYLETNGDAETKTSKVTICTGKTNNEYGCIDGVVLDLDLSVDDTKLSTYNYNKEYSNTVFELKNYIKCDETGCNTDHDSYVSRATFVKKEVTKEQSYITPTAFYQLTSSGKVIAYDEGYNIDKDYLNKLDNKLPISTSSVGGGVFKLMIEGLGEFYNSNSAYGRLMDYGKSTNSVASVVGVAKKYTGEYVCYYKNDCRPANCPDCTFTCEGDGCSWKKCPDCKIICENCIFNLGKLNLQAKTIATTNVNAANRARGYNWITSTELEKLNLSTELKEKLSLVSTKADKTIKEIEEVNEQIYEKTTDGSKLAFSIKLTPEIIEKITSYNSEQEDKGGYINDSLSCYDAVIEGNTYKNIYCYSELIDDLMKDNSDNITVYNRINDVDERESKTQTSGYWTLWEENNNLIKSESIIGGPSWK